MRRITINGQDYPFRMTMGALLRFKRETGKDVSEVKTSDVADLVVLLWCCVASSCKADGVPFTYTLEDFADALDASTLDVLNEEMGAGTADQKKTAM